MRREKMPKRFIASVLAAGLTACATPNWAIDIFSIQPAALDQPRINAYVALTPGGTPQTYEQDFFNIQAFFDTGASGVLMSLNTAGMLNVQPALAANGTEIIFSDVGVAGTDDFYVSNPLYFGLAPFHPDAMVDDLSQYQTVYNQTFANIRAQIGPKDIVIGNPYLSDLDVFGMPLMQGKVVVMDPKPVNTFLDTMRTYVYNPGTPPTTDPLNDPGIPVTDLHVSLSFADFTRFTTVTPAGEPGPTLAANPFIGPNPVLKLDDPNAPDATPPVQFSLNGITRTGSFLLDTGAAASILSEAKAAELGVTYDPNADPDNPILLGVPLGDQFQLTIGGIGGQKKIAGFFLDDLVLPTDEGDPIRFVRAPVLVSDITVRDPQTNQTLTLDGIFGMNYLVASAFVTEADPFPIIDRLTFGRFDWLVFDQPNKKLGLKVLQGDLNQQGINWIGAIFDRSYWDAGDYGNWMSVSGRVYFEDGDFVNFDDGLTFGNILILPADGNVYIRYAVAPGGISFNNNQVQYTFRGGPISGFTPLVKKGTGSVTFLNQNTYTGPTDIRQGTIYFMAPQDIGPVYVRAGGQAVLGANQRFRELNISGGLARFTGGAFKLVTESLAIMDGGRFDIGDSVVIINSTPQEREAQLARLTDMLGSARRGPAGLWTGPGLTSSSWELLGNPDKAIGAMLNDRGNGQTFYATFFDGQPVNQNSFLIRITWNGDTDLDGDVDLDDYARIDNGFLNKLKGWFNGDFNYDGRINADDYFLMDRAYFHANGTAAGIPVHSALLPEPIGAGTIGILSMMALARRRRAG